MSMDRRVPLWRRLAITMLSDPDVVWSEQRLCENLRVSRKQLMPALAYAEARGAVHRSKSLDGVWTANLVLLV